MSKGVLDGIKVLEIAGLAPAPYAGMILADFGADVVRIDRVNSGFSMDVLARGKRSIELDLKSEEGKKTLMKLVGKADVLIEPFRPGVMERLKLGPEVLCPINHRLIYARMTGWGQGGDPTVGRTAGHDQNYLALSGILSALRRKGEKPTPPINLLADFAGGGLMCAMGVLLALLERERSGKGQVIDAAMTDGANYVGIMIYRSVMFGSFSNDHDLVGTNLLDTGAPFYDTYVCKDGKFLSVGCIEPQFFNIFIEKLGVDRKTFLVQNDQSRWPEMKLQFEQIIRTKTRDEWAVIFKGTDACVFPVLSFLEAQKLKHNQLRGIFGESADKEGALEPMPAPKLSRTPGLFPRKSPEVGAHNDIVLSEYGFSKSEIAKLVRENVIGGSKL